MPFPLIKLVDDLTINVFTCNLFRFITINMLNFLCNELDIFIIICEASEYHVEKNILSY